MKAVEKFNAQDIKLSSGAIARLNASSYDDLSTIDTIGTPENPASLWVAPFSALALTAQSDTPTGRKLSDCASLMASSLGVTYRTIDAFTLPSDIANLPIKALLQPSNDAKHRAPKILTGSPRYASSGLLAALAATSLATNSAPPTFSAQTVTGNLDRIRSTQQNLRSYFTSDYDAITWLAHREGGIPLAVLTTQQNFRTYTAYNPNADLQWSRIASPAMTLDYPLCTIKSNSTRPNDLEAIDAARIFFFNDEFKSLLAEAGFAPAQARSETLPTGVGTAARVLISNWPEIRRPVTTAFVIDTSIKTDRTIMETLRREIKGFIEVRPSKDDTVALISASSTPDILSDPSDNQELLLTALARLTTAGSNAIRDGIQTAFTLFGDLNQSNHRSSIVVFTSTNDTSSQTSVNQLTNRALQFVGRRDVDLYVFAFGKSEQAFGELPNITRQVGGTFILTDTASLPSAFFTIARRIQ